MLAKEFTKSHGDDIDDAWAREMHLYEASTVASRFSAPRPLRMNREDGSIASASLPTGNPLCQILKAKILGQPESLVASIGLVQATGRALAELHALLKPINDRCLSLSFDDDEISPQIGFHVRDVLRGSPISAMHGDLGHGNIWVGKSGDIWIYDPLPSLFCPDKSAGRASIYYDIGQMVMSLWAVYPLKMYATVPLLPRLEWISAFVTGYQEYCSVELDITTVLAVAARILENYAKYTATAGLRGAGFSWILHSQHRALAAKALETVSRE